MSQKQSRLNSKDKIGIYFCSSQRGHWTVFISNGIQSFPIGVEWSSKKEAKWYARQIKLALDKSYNANTTITQREY